MTITIGPTDPGFLAAAWLTLILAGVFWASVMERRAWKRDTAMMLDALWKIRSSATPHCNATVRRMANIAWEASARR